MQVTWSTVINQSGNPRKPCGLGFQSSLRLAAALARVLLTVLLGLALPAAAVAGTDVPPPSLVCDAPEWDFGELAAGTKRSHAYVLRNSGANLVRIQRVRATCGCTAAASASVVSRCPSGRLTPAFCSR